MASQLDIANWAMMLIGEKRLSALSDDVGHAENISAGWDMLRDSAIKRSAWHCHIERTSVAADSDAPSWGYDAQYTLAGDVVRVLQVGDVYPYPDMSDFRGADLAPWRIEGRKILTNYGTPLKVKWLVNSVDIGSWDISFCKLLAADIADYLQPRASEAIAQRIRGWRMDAWAEALSTNAIEDPSEAMADDTFMAAHYG